MLVVTSSVGVVDWVHSDSCDNGEICSLGLVSPELSSSLKNWLFVSSTCSDDSDHGSGLSVNGFSHSRGEFDSGLKSILAVGNNGYESSGSSGELSVVSFSELDVGDQSTFRDLTDWQNVSDLQRGCFSAENCLTSEHSLDSKIVLGDFLVLVRILELDLGDWGSSSWVVQDLLDNSLDVAVSFLVVEVLVSGLSESSVGEGLEDRGVLSSLSLRSDGSSHGL